MQITRGLALAILGFTALSIAAPAGIRSQARESWIEDLGPVVTTVQQARSNHANYAVGREPDSALKREDVGPEPGNVLKREAVGLNPMS